MVDVPKPDKLVQLISQETIKTTDTEQVIRFKYKVWGVSNADARSRARVWTRKKVPNARNIFKPNVGKTEQSTFDQYFGGLGEAEFREVELVVVKPMTFE